MEKENRVKVWFQQIRGPFLILSVVLVLIGISTAHIYGFHNWFYSTLLLVGIILSHISVNLFNELSDYHTMIDENTNRTPFSGGSGMLQSRSTTVRAVNIVAYSTLIIAFAIGLYFCFVSGWFILVLMISGAIAIRFYTSYLSHWLIGELISGLTLGTFVVIGSHYALTMQIPLKVIYISIPPGILTSLLLFLNEFPDAEADKKGGRKHLVIQFGKKKSAVIYFVCLLIIYLMILLGPFVIKLPYTSYIALITLPLAVMNIQKVFKNFDNHAKLVPALGINVGIVILTDLMIGIGYLL